jgi:hypothetical protein
MTDEGLKQEIKDISESLDKLSDSDSLNKQQRRQSYILSLKKAALLNIKEAREKGDNIEEYRSIAQYGMLASYGDKHPLLLFLARSKFGIGL